MTAYTVPGMKADSAERLTALLQERLNSLNDLALTLKHVHWNVTGPNFIAVHTMLEPPGRGGTRHGRRDGRADRHPGRIAVRDAGRARRPARLGRLLHRPRRDPAAPRRPGRGLRGDHRGPPGRDRHHRGTRPGHPGHAYRAGTRPGGVPLVRPRPPRGARRLADHRERPHREGSRPARHQEAVTAPGRPGHRSWRRTLSSRRAATTRSLTLVFCDWRESSSSACSALIPRRAISTPLAWSITARESIALFRSSASLRASVTRRALAIAATVAVMYTRSSATSRAPKPCGISLYRFSDPTNSLPMISGQAR